MMEHLYLNYNHHLLHLQDLLEMQIEQVKDNIWHSSRVTGTELWLVEWLLLQEKIHQIKMMDILISLQHLQVEVIQEGFALTQVVILERALQLQVLLMEVTQIIQITEEFLPFMVIVQL